MVTMGVCRYAVLGAFIQGALMGLAVGQETTTAEITPVATTSAPTKATRGTKALPRDVVLATDPSFSSFYVDPFENDESDTTDFFPPTVIASKGAVSKFWKNNKVIVPSHLDFVAFTVWSGDPGAITPYDLQDIQVKVKPSKDTLKSEIIVRHAETTTVDVIFECNEDGETLVEFEVSKTGYVPWTFGVTKVCMTKRSEELIISTTQGNIVYAQADVASAFNVHDLRTESYIASKEIQTESFVIHTIHREYRVVGVPVVESYQPTKGLLDIIASRSPSLHEVVEEFRANGGKDSKAEEFYEENDDKSAEIEEEENGDTEDDDDDPYDNGIDRSFKDKTGTQKKKALPTKVVTPESETLSLNSEICKPELSGPVMKKTLRDGSIKILHRRDFGEEKLMGFAQAGVLGLHGGKYLNLDYNCLKDGLAVIVIRLNVQPIEGENEHEEEIRLSWLKVCSAEKVAPDEIDLMGFNVHLGMFMKEEPAFFPIINGITTTAFTWGSLDMIASPEELTTSFYAQLSEAVEKDREEKGIKEFVRIRRVRVNARDNGRKPVLNIRLSGHGVSGGLVSSEALPIIVHYNCLRTGNIDIGLDLLVDIVTVGMDGSVTPKGNDRVRRLSFYWEKRCSVVPMFALFATAINPALFTKSDEDDNAAVSGYPEEPIIKRGKTEPRFSSSGDSMFTLSSEQNVFATELYKARARVKGEPPHQEVGIRFAEPRLTSSNTGIAVALRDIMEMEELANIGKKDFLLNEGDEAFSKKEDITDKVANTDFEVERDDPVYLVVDHTCMTVGTAVITMELQVFGNSEQVMRYQWIKECSWSDTIVSGQTAGGAVLFFVVLAITVSSSVFCIMLRRYKMRIKFLESKDKHGFEKMDVISSM